MNNESGGNRKETPGKDVGMCERSGALSGKEGEGNESTREKEERKT